jgi:patatin-related protein
MANRAELRLALVCYGGVSLAVYMHGVTKELQSLIRAARAFDKSSSENPVNPFRAGNPPYGTEAAYFDALVDQARNGRRLSVSIDIIGGTSAGGINGIALSKALALGASQQPLKKVWIDDGDIRKLLRAPSWPPILLQAVIAAARQVIRFRSPTSPLRGELMSQLIMAALKEMDRAKDEPPLVPANGSLELFVPATDLDGFEVLVPSGAGGASQRDRLNAQVFKFSFKNREFDESFTPDLAFAGRASASFPGAFAPVSQESFEKETRGKHIEFHSSVFEYPYADDQNAKKVYFVDGGVLDNAPFDVVITAISRRRADSEIYRRIAYIEPDPGRDLYSAAVATLPPRRRWLKDLLTVSKVKGNHPFLRELLALRDMNHRIGEVNAIVERQKEYVVGAVTCELDKQRDPSEPVTEPKSSGAPGATKLMVGVTDKEKTQTISDAMHEWARDALGPTFWTYQRLKFQAALECLADELARRFRFAPQSGQASFLHAAIVAWARAQDFWKHEPANTSGDKKRLIDDRNILAGELDPIDVPYRERRLLFILAGINELYTRTGEDPRREDLDKLKSLAWNELEHLRGAPRRVVGKIPYETVKFLSLEVVDQPSASRRDDPLLADPTTFAEDKDNDLQFDALLKAYQQGMKKELVDGSCDLWEAFISNTSGREWSNTDKQTLLTRYLGFPLWDGMIFPTISLTRLPQFSPIGVSQFSPLMATKLRPPVDDKGNPTEKLEGAPYKHFAGFFDANSRENDYLWGRLDGVELILRLLQEVGESEASPEAAAGRADEPIPHLADGLTAVLDTETDLKRVPKLRENLKKQVANLADVEAAANHKREAPESRRPGAAEEGGRTLTI